MAKSMVQKTTQKTVSFKSMVCMHAWSCLILCDPWINSPWAPLSMERFRQECRWIAVFSLWGSSNQGLEKTTFPAASPLHTKQSLNHTRTHQAHKVLTFLQILKKTSFWCLYNLAFNFFNNSDIDSLPTTGDAVLCQTSESSLGCLWVCVF